MPAKQFPTKTVSKGLNCRFSWQGLTGDICLGKDPTWPHSGGYSKWCCVGICSLSAGMSACQITRWLRGLCGITAHEPVWRLKWPHYVSEGGWRMFPDDCVTSLKVVRIHNAVMTKLTFSVYCPFFFFFVVFLPFPFKQIYTFWQQSVQPLFPIDGATVYMWRLPLYVACEWWTW